MHPLVQSRENFHRLMRHRGLDSFGLSVLHAAADRCWCLVGPDVEQMVLDRFDQLERAGDLQQAGAMGHKVPGWIVQGCGSTRAVRMRGYRGRFPRGLGGDQMVLYRMFCDGVAKEMILEADADLASPIDVAGFLPHVLTVWRNHRLKRQTDPLEVARVLDEAGIV